MVCVAITLIIVVFIGGFVIDDSTDALIVGLGIAFTLAFMVTFVAIAITIIIIVLTRRVIHSIEVIDHFKLVIGKILPYLFSVNPKATPSFTRL